MYMKSNNLEKTKRKKVIMMFLGHKLNRYKRARIKASTLRTEIGNFAAALALRDKKIPAGVRKIQRYCNKELHAAHLNKAKPFTWRELKKVAKSMKLTKKEKVLLMVCWITAQRLGNMASLELSMTTHALLFTMKRHKTSAHLGRLRASIAVEHIPSELRRRLARWPGVRFSEATVRSVGVKMRKAGLRFHSLRRGGIRYLKMQGWTEDQIREVTGHTSNKALQGYLEND